MDATTDPMGVVDDQTPRHRMRAGDADRERVAEQLRSAHAEGRLELTEYDERVQRAWAATAPLAVPAWPRRAGCGRRLGQR